MEKWKAVKHDTLKGGAITAPNQNGDGLSEIVAHYYEEADAQRIVKAVNCHDDLVKALTEIDRHIYVSGTNDTRIQQIMSELGIPALAKAERK